MRYWLCMNPRRDALAKDLSEFLDAMEVAWEWQDLPNANEVDRLIVVQADSPEHLTELMQKVPDRRVVTAFGYGQLEEVQDGEVN